MSKADVLGKLLASGSSAFVVDDFQAIAAREWKRDREGVLDLIESAGLGPLIAVRSSADSESLRQSSPPGSFLSELDVPTANRALVSSAIDRVFGSMKDTQSAAGVLVQHQLTHAVLAGVATTMTGGGAPYITIEYDTSGRTDLVTSGNPVRRAVLVPPGRKGTRWRSLLTALNEVGEILDSVDLVVEFAVSEDGVVHIFQAWDRGRQPAFAVDRLRQGVRKAHRSLARLRAQAGGSVLSDMADWNPAEILGPEPKRLDVYLYRTLVTDSVWSEARGRLGYSRRPGPLLLDVGGHPFINVIESLRSLVPDSLDSASSDHYVRACEAKVRSTPALHDKLEHEVLTTYWPLHDPDGTLRSRVTLAGSTHVALAQALMNLSTSLLSRWRDELRWIQGQIDQLALWQEERRFDAVVEGELSTTQLQSLIRAGIRRCRAQGTLPFAIAARLAFVADGLVREIGLSTCDGAAVESFWRSLRTPADRFRTALADPRVDEDEFICEFGHLRPHMYNVASPRLAEQQTFVRALRAAPPRTPSRTGPAEVAPAVHDRFREYVQQLGVAPEKVDVNDLLDAVALREVAKFEFSRVLSDTLERVALLGARAGLTRAQVRSTSLSTLLAPTGRTTHSALDSSDARWSDLLLFPDVVLPDTTLDDFEYVEARPTFVTTSVVYARIWRLTAMPIDPTELDGRVVAIDAADPGFDWIFSRPIAGLVTCFGGSSSHMAVRCQQHGLPAAIGVGFARFDALLHDSAVVLDCSSGTLRPVSAR